MDSLPRQALRQVRAVIQLFLGHESFYRTGSPKTYV